MWRAPSVVEVLRGLPFLHHLPATLFDWLLERGQLLGDAGGPVQAAPWCTPPGQPPRYCLACCPPHRILAGRCHRGARGAGMRPGRRPVHLGLRRGALQLCRQAVLPPCCIMPTRAARRTCRAAATCQAALPDAPFIAPPPPPPRLPDPSGARHEYFLGSGGVLGLLGSLVGQPMRGSGAVVAEANALHKGPVVFHLPQARLACASAPCSTICC